MNSNNTKHVNKYVPCLSYFSVSSYRVTASGDLTQVDDTAIINVINNTNAKPILVITNFTGEEFLPDITRELFTNKEVY